MRVRTLDPQVAGLGSFLRFLIHHFDDTRVVSPDMRDLLLQSISVLTQYTEFVRVRAVAAVCAFVPSRIARSLRRCLLRTLHTWRGT